MAKTIMEESKTNLNKRILKALGIFGGTQSIQIICSFVRNKFAAVLLGTEGIGLLAVFNNALDLLTSSTQLSIRQSALRDVTKADTADKLHRIAYIVLRWSWLLGIVGAIITLIAAPWLSEYSFGNKDYTLHFSLLSVAIFLCALQSGWQIIIQGTDDMKSLAKSQLWGAIFGAIASIILYFWLGLASIVPSILAYTIANTIATAFYRKKLTKPEVIPSMKEVLKDGYPFIRLGFFMTISLFSSVLASYIYIGWLYNNASVEELGLFNAGNTIINRYAALLFAAIGYEYYPRLCKIISSKSDVSLHVSGESNMSLIVLLPLICIYLSFDSFFISLLYSDDFHPILPYMKWAMLGTIFKAVSWCMAVTIMAKGNGRDYIITEVLSSIIFVITHIFFFRKYGIEGWGYAYMIWYAAYTVLIGYFYFIRYKFKLELRSWLIFITCTSISLLAIYVSNISQTACISLTVCVSLVTALFLYKGLKNN